MIADSFLCPIPSFQEKVRLTSYLYLNTVMIIMVTLPKSLSGERKMKEREREGYKWERGWEECKWKRVMTRKNVGFHPHFHTPFLLSGRRMRLFIYGLSSSFHSNLWLIFYYYFITLSAHVPYKHANHINTSIFLYLPPSLSVSFQFVLVILFDLCFSGWVFPSLLVSECIVRISQS